MLKHPTFARTSGRTWGTRLCHPLGNVETFRLSPGSPRFPGFQCRIACNEESHVRLRCGTNLGHPAAMVLPEQCIGVTIAAFRQGPRHFWSLEALCEEL